MKKRHLKIVLGLLLSACIIGIFLFFRQENNEQNGEKFQEAEAESEENTLTYDDGDFIYLPSIEEIEYDTEENITFHKNILDVSLTAEINETQEEDLMSIANGEIVGKISGPINRLQIKVDAPELDQLFDLAEEISELEFVDYATFSTPLFLSDLNNDSSNSDDEGNSDWWIKAIHADVSGEYIDQFPEDFESVNVTVMEKGGLKEDEDLEHIEVTKNRVEESDHAERVTKIIDSSNSEYGKRGLAHGVADTEFVSVGSKLEQGKNVFTQYLKNLSNNIEKGSVIINNSWGNPLQSEERFDSEKNFLEKIFFDKSYTT